MGESRDANDPRDAMRRMRREAEAEFEESETHDSGGQEHASRADREGTAPRKATSPRPPSPPRGGGEGTR